MATEVHAMTDIRIDNSEDEVENGQIQPLNEPSKELRDEDPKESRELVQFLWWKIKKQNEKKIIKSAILYFGFFALGTLMSITGPTLLDLAIITDSSVDEIAYVLTGRAFGGFGGGVVTSVLVNYVNNWVILAYAMVIKGILVISYPFCSILSVMIFMHVIAGVHSVMFDAGGNVTLLAIWGKDHGPWMQALHCIFGVGALMGPLIAKPFLSEIQDSEKNPEAGAIRTVSNYLEEDNETTSGLIDSDGNITSMYRAAENIAEAETDVMYAYIIVGIISICAGLAFFMIFIASPPRQVIKSKEEKKNEETNEDTKPDNLTFKIPFLIGVFVFYVSYCMVEGNYGNFLLSYSVESLGWSKSMGATVTTVFFTSFTIGRALGIVLVNRVSPQILLGADCFLSLVALIPLLLFAHSHDSVLWISSIVLGLTMSTIFATGITWTERYVDVSGGVGTIFLIAGSIGEIVGPLLLSILYKKYGMEAFVYIMFTATTITFVLYTILQACAYKKGERYVANGKEDNKQVEEELDAKQHQEDEDAEKEREIEVELQNMLKRHMDRDNAQDDASEVEV